ncbi:MAG TPA: uroporphyrinogen-III synthase [Acetobacteraceae bacterium]
MLITRPQPAAAETARRVTAMGRRVVVAPLLEIRSLNPVLPSDADAVLVTSRNAVPALPDWARNRPVFAVGAATAGRARRAGFTDIRNADGDAAMLALLVRRELPAGRRLLLLTGKGQGETLRAMLRDHAAEVTRCAVYEALPAPRLPEPAREALGGRSVGAALFFSAETARCMVRLVQEAALEETVGVAEACAIGRAVAVALGSLPWRRIRTAAHPTQDEMLALLQ